MELSGDLPAWVYKAAVISDGNDWEQGRVRVEPPFIGSDRLFELLSEDVGVQLLPVATEKEATMLDFYVDKSSPSAKNSTNRERVRTTVKALLHELDIVGSERNFLYQYERRGE